MLSVKMGEKGTSKKNRVHESSRNLDEQNMVKDAVSLQMILHVDILEEITKKVGSKKNKAKVSPSDKDTYVYVHNYIDFVDNKSNTIWNIVEAAETTIDSHVEPNVEPYGEPPVGPHVEPLCETFAKCYGKPLFETPTKLTIG